jgi:hypothetical protein
VQRRLRTVNTVAMYLCLLVRSRPCSHLPPRLAVDCCAIVTAAVLRVAVAVQSEQAVAMVLIPGMLWVFGSTLASRVMAAWAMGSVSPQSSCSAGRLRMCACMCVHVVMTASGRSPCVRACRFYVASCLRDLLWLPRLHQVCSCATHRPRLTSVCSACTAATTRCFSLQMAEDVVPLRADSSSSEFGLPCVKSYSVVLFHVSVAMFSTHEVC